MGQSDPSYRAANHIAHIICFHRAISCELYILKVWDPAPGMLPAVIGRVHLRAR